MPKSRKTPRRDELLHEIDFLKRQLTNSSEAEHDSAQVQAGLEAQLRQQLRALAARVSLSEERERRRIAVEIHDRISQKLALCKMQLSGVRQAIAPGSEGVFEGVLELLAELIEDTRHLTFELSPPVLYELGFVRAIEWLAEQFEQSHKITVEVQSPRTAIELTNDVRVLLFQCTRELLNNIVKHSGAKHAKIRLRRSPHEIYLAVSDDGVGFEVADSPVTPTGITSFGLFSIRQRMEEVGGSLRVTSRKDIGTNAVLTIPTQFAGANGDTGVADENTHLAGRRSPDRAPGTAKPSRSAPRHGSRRGSRRRAKGR